MPLDQLGPRGPAMAEAVEACVHCGFCLPACPTYRALGAECDSPRGRIVLMKESLERGESETARGAIDRCLGCLACETACPSGVEYRSLVTAYRAQSTSSGPTIALRVMTSRTLARWALRTARLVRPLAGALPKRLRVMIDLAPRALPAAATLQQRYEAHGSRRGRVALLTGCIQHVIAPEIARATIELLTANGVEVLVPEGQSCCGALALSLIHI